MEPISSKNRTSPEEPSPAEVEAGACLPQEPESLPERPRNIRISPNYRLQSPSPSAPPPSPAAVKALVDKHPPSVLAAPLTPTHSDAKPSNSASHPGVALSIAVNAAMPGKIGGGEASVGVVVDLAEPKISVFTSSASGKAAASGISVGVSGQASLVGDTTKFFGSGTELGASLPRGGASLNFSTPAPGGPLELNGVTVSYGPSLGVDAHYFEGTTTEQWSLGWNGLKNAIKQIAGLPGLRRLGP